jgi:hypothetical protein
LSDVHIKVEPVPGTTLAESKDQARTLRTKRVLPALEQGRHVVLDFTDVGFATQSFVHALISEAIRRYREGVFDVMEFKGCSPEVQQTVLTVFEYTLAASDAADELQAADEWPDGPPIEATAEA